MPAPIDHLDEAEIARRLAIAQAGAPTAPSPEITYPPEILPPSPVPAAVLIPLLRQDNAWHVLYTRRTDTLPEHSGQVAFPGGRADPGDTGPEMTAARESFEELGIQPGDIRFLGRLHDFLTVTNYVVTPVVGVIPWPYPLRPAAEEVSRAFTISLAWLADPANREERIRSLPEPFRPATVIYFKPYDNEVLWGASARFTVRLIEALSNPGPGGAG